MWSEIWAVIVKCYSEPTPQTMQSPALLPVMRILSFESLTIDVIVEVWL